MKTTNNIAKKIVINPNSGYKNGTYYVNYDDVYIYTDKQDQNITCTRNQRRDLTQADFEQQHDVSQPLSQSRFDEIRDHLIDRLISLPGFEKTDGSTDTKKATKTIAKSAESSVLLADLNWGFSVTLMPESFTSEGKVSADYAKNFTQTMKTIRKALLDKVPSVYARTGSLSMIEIQDEHACEYIDTYIS